MQGEWSYDDAAVAREPDRHRSSGMRRGKGHREAAGRVMIGLGEESSSLNGLHELADFVGRIVLDSEGVPVGCRWA